MYVYLFCFTYLFTHLSTISYLISSFLTHFHSLVLYNFCYLLNTYFFFNYNIKCEVTLPNYFWDNKTKQQQQQQN